jgi:4-amino-4-deoxy-L-arabinose transferase-like glycosyltransferase
VYAAAAVLTLVAGVTLFARLESYPLWEPDEARHAEIAREMVEHANWVLPTLYGSPYHHKPVLYYWLTAAAYAAGGRSTVTARVVSGAAGVLVLLAVFAWARAAWGLRAATLSALTLVTTVEFVALGRYGDLNMLLTLWVTVAILALHRWASRDGRGPGLLLAAVACGLGMLTKGLVAPALIAGVGLVHLWRTRRLHLLRRWEVALAAVVFVAVAAPWYVMAALRAPGYLRDFFFEYHLRRALGGDAHLHPEPFYFAPLAAALCFLPWTLLLPAALQRAARRRHDESTGFCLSWAVFVVLLFTLPRGKLASYLLPAMPPLALVIGKYWADLTRRVPNAAEGRLFRIGVGAFAILGVAAPLLALVATARHAGGTWLPLAACSLVLCPFGIVVAWLAATHRSAYAPLIVVAAMLVGYSVFYTWGAPMVSTVFSDDVIARTIMAADPSRHAPVVAFRTSGGSLPFYLDRPVRLLNSQSRLRRVLARRSLVFVMTHRWNLRGLRRVPTLWVWREGRHMLFASQPRPLGSGA